jgi:hypothetical protein
MIGEAKQSGARRLAAASGPQSLAKNKKLCNLNQLTQTNRPRATAGQG